ncbi:hypothetical protein A3A76_02085 [Candidatus Woesebacteria bacterium RIFCSPLOWO2_01_FULL_39_23]|nr:MAG: hypothetical protein A3E41_03595 [Candidatus Woesebacteria bacterium RIFCSPHIGHO2_12_FULL_38_9]OGM62347.1 MAG: hypothetical protein A3A76_02085 [Candidatus Woesebacteria bacterium RIFCSPLOWO2_01_FULL_39_23]
MVQEKYQPRPDDKLGKIPTASKENIIQNKSEISHVENSPVGTNNTPSDENYPFHDYSGNSEEEEFVYTPKLGSQSKKLLRVLVMVITFIAILVPLIYLLTKLKPGDGKNIGVSGEIVWWGLGYTKDVVQPLIDEYVKENPNSKITFIEESPTDYRERLANSLSQGKGPDVLTIHNSWVPMFREALDIMPREFMTYDDFARTYYPVAVGDLTTGSGIVGVPLEYDGLTLYINESIFSTAGKIPPRTWDQFRQLAGELTTRNDKGIIIQSGSSVGITQNVDYWPEIVGLLMYQNKANLYKPAGTDAAQAEEAISFYSDFSAFDKVWDTTLPRSTEAFAEGKVAMYFGPARAIDTINKFNRNLNFKTIPIPQVRRNDPTEPDVSYASYWVEGVWNKSADKELAWDLLKFLSQPESLEKMFNNSAKAGVIGKPYPRIDMRDKLINDAVLGSIVALAPNAKSWYLAGGTNDGATGLNSLLAEVYKKGVDTLVATKNRKAAKNVVETISSEAEKVYAKFGIGPR